jgi:serine/threonine protein kinase
MIKLLSCGQGHFWEAEATDGESAPRCPVCGGADESPALDLTSSEPTETSIKPAEEIEPLPLCDAKGLPAVAGYTILEDLGRASTGVRHFRARQQIVNRIVRLEVVLARDDPGQRAWGALRGEANALAKLSHPNIMQLLDVGERDRQLFYNTLEDVEGQTLADALVKKPLPWRRAAELAETLARAIHHAHERGVVHRSLKPSSIFACGKTEDAAVPLSSIGNVKIGDFGLARRPVEGDLIDFDLQAAAPHYLSPEQAWGRAKEIGPSCDVHALGAILFEMLAGRPPFVAATPLTIIDEIQTREAPRASSMVRGVPADLDAIVRKCLQKQPRKRYDTARELADDLRHVLERRPVMARTSTMFERSGLWIRRQPATAALLMLLIVTLVGSVVAGTLVAIQNSTSQEEFRQQTLSERDDLQRRVRDAESSRRLLTTALAQAHYAHVLSQIETELTRNNGRARAILDQCAAEMRHWEWFHLSRRVAGGKRVQLSVQIGPVTSLAFRPGSTMLAASAGVVKIDPLKRREAHGEVRLWDSRIESEGFSWSDFEGPVYQVAFSKERLFAVGINRGHGELRGWDVVRKQEVVPRQALLASTGYGMAVSTDGMHLLIVDMKHRIRVFDLLSFWLSPEYVPAGGPWDFAHPGALSVVALDESGKHFALTGSAAGSISLCEAPPVVTPETELVGHADAVLALAFHPNPATLASASQDHTVRLWNVSPGSPPGETRTLKGHLGAVTSVSFSHDGKRLASGSEDGTVRVWDPTTGQLLLGLDVPGDGPIHVAFSSDDNPQWMRLAIARGKDVVVWGPGN